MTVMSIQPGVWIFCVSFVCWFVGAADFGVGGGGGGSRMTVFLFIYGVDQVFVAVS